MSKDKINHEQFLTKEHINSLTPHKGMRDFLLSLKGNSVAFMPTKTAGEHIKLHVIGDGSVFMSQTPSDHRALKNAMADVRRTVRENIDPTWNYPEGAPGQKQQKKKVKPTEQEPQTDEPA